MYDVSFLELVSRYAADKHLRPKSVSTYTAVVRLFRRYLGHEAYPSMVTRPMVIEWRTAIIRTSARPDGITEASWNNYVRHLKALYNFGIKHQLIACAHNPFLEVSVKQPKAPKKSLQPLQIRYAREVLEVCRRFETAYDECSKIHPAWFWQVLMETFFYTGIRLNQLLHIQAGDVNLKKRIFRASAAGSKTHSESILPIPDGLYPHLYTLIVAAHNSGFKRQDQLFNVNRFSHRHRRTDMDTWQVEHFFQVLSEMTGCKLSPHRFRHFLGTSLMESPERNIHLTQNILNHTDIRTTMEYVHPDVEAMRRALNARPPV
ncbi:site-specific recombinase XerC [Modicisalibacter xianhensis]|uniref:Site-specific recombinase XerC n=1 Tax=Modicisalibacter xianhensis TaxID=442341 RepID=A0A4R8FTK7_9GAMM|nr:site-specific integrase [Halomonas xianhensis]TDX30025.1 site-specific recombinase XerC [Halomonas xianhensis]